MTKGGSEVCSRAMMYKAVANTVFLYGSEIWVVMGAMLMVIEGFNHLVDRLLVVKIDRSAGGGDQEWPPVEEVLKVEGLCPIK